ncbi:MAG: Cof-type HAD-IIB family hydrolase [Spirochaetaceae bacterium]|jgi:Cof subfamily protein (haloacid dehalogenase superfamily)|nr:Cof-type HAD-IIB family hydrolase [Spirochaetaceae bacterium]
MRKLVFVDIDGTLMGSDQTIPESAVAACRGARRNGHLLYICTGRPFKDIFGEVKAVGFDGIVSASGARIDIGDKTVSRFFMHTEIVARIGAYMEAREEAFLFELSDGTVKSRYVENFLEEVRLALAGKASKKETESFVKFFKFFSANAHYVREDFYHEDVQKIVFMGSRVSLADMVETFGGECEICGGSIPFFGTHGGEISPSGVHKGAALETVASHHGIPLGDTIAVGDSDNDRRMLECAGIGIAMGNAEESLKAIADYTTSSLKDGGLAQAFRHCGLI